MLQCNPIVKNSSSTEIPNNLHPISYASKTLSETESNYSNIEQELLGVVFALTHFKHFTYGRPVTIISDHKPLVSLFKKSLTSSSPHLSRMLLQILDYDLSIVYQEGSKMHLSDAISQLSIHKPDHGSTLPGMDIPLSTGIPLPAAMMGRDFRGPLPHLQHFLPDSTEELLVHCHEN